MLSLSYWFFRRLFCVLLCASVVVALLQDHRGVRPTAARTVSGPIDDPGPGGSNALSSLPRPQPEPANNNSNKNAEREEEARLQLQSPHSGRHFVPSHPAYRRRIFQRRRRFTEGWYYRLTIPNVTSFAFIFSIEDPGCRESNLRLACAQVIGPDNGYLVQGSRDDTAFWASKHEAAFGCTFATKAGASSTAAHTAQNRATTELDADEWDETVESGFQILPSSLKGLLDGKDGTVGDILDDDVGGRFKCEFDIAVRPIVGWGGTRPEEQKSTAGWLASFPVFEPHWQVLLADARATGHVVWKNATYQFQDVPFYAEKNWGAALPQKWYWTQCNSFPGYEQLSVVAGGGIRKLPLGKQEALGMVSIHYNGVFYEGVPWMGGMSWSVDTWGRWILEGNSTMGERLFAAKVTYETDDDGLVFRAPTPNEGLVRFCRDTFDAKCTVWLWELRPTKENSRTDYDRIPIIEGAISYQGGAEIGGGPWWDTWSGESRLKPPVKALLRIPGAISRWRRRRR